jgi:hypothetical protein
LSLRDPIRPGISLVFPVYISSRLNHSPSIIITPLLV